MRVAGLDEELAETVRARVAFSGWAVVSCPIEGLVYTVGLTGLGKPEFVRVARGGEVAAAETCLDILARFIVIGRVNDGDAVGGVIVEEELAGERLVIAEAVYGVGRVRAWAVWMDGGGRA